MLTKFVNAPIIVDDGKVIVSNPLDNNAAFVARSHRDDKLTETDWWACSDVTLTDARKDYRKALRDIPSASGWPHTHTWPTKPS